MGRGWVFYWGFLGSGLRCMSSGGLRGAIYDEMDAGFNPLIYKFLGFNFLNIVGTSTLICKFQILSLRLSIN